MFRMRHQLIRQLGLIYIFNGGETADDPKDRSFAPEESVERMKAIITQHPDTGIAEVYRQELEIDVLNTTPQM